MKRKVIQVVNVAMEQHDIADRYLALCDDGSLWVRYFRPTASQFVWEAIDGPPEEIK